MNKFSVCKKLWAVCLALLLCAALVLPALAAEDGMYEYEITEQGTAVITRYLGSGNSTVTLPVSLGSYPVSGVGEYAFGKSQDGELPHKEVENIVFHSGITDIGDRAFAGTSWIGSKNAGDADGFVIVNGILIAYNGTQTAVSVPESVTRVNVGAFEKKDFIREAVLPAGVVQIGDFAFYKCTGLERIVIAGDLQSIGKSAFYGCESLKTIACPEKPVFPDSLQSVGENAFYGCSSLSGEILFGKGLETIGTYAFANCPGVTGVTVPDTVKQIGVCALGFILYKQNGDYYAKRQENFVIRVSHEEADSAEAEAKVLESYSKSRFPIYAYARDPDGNGHYAAIPLDWARLQYPFQLGDVNNDGKVNSSDARDTLRHAAKLEMLTHEDDLRAGDVNFDGKVNSSDARKILRANAKLEALEETAD